MAKLYIENLFDSASASPSTVLLKVPIPGSARTSVTGLLASEVTIEAQNTWGPIVNDISNLTDFSSMMGSTGLFSWIGASTMCWKGTKPLAFSVDFYLINYRRGLGLEDKLVNLTKLASLYQANNATALGKSVKVQVHGGYAADVLETNPKYWSENKEAISDFIDNLDSDGTAQGSVSVTLGGKVRIRNVLLSKIGVTPSLVQVADEWGGNVLPLYYRVQASFIGVRALIDQDVENMFSYNTTIASSSNPPIVGRGSAGGGGDSW